MKLVTRNTYVTKVWLKLGVVFLPLCFLLLCTESLFSQAETGRITGTVSDSTGAVLPDVEVTIVAVETNRRRTFVTDIEGRYSSGPLQVGEYRVEAQLTAFKRLVRDGISLEVQETALVNLQLELGAITEQVTVTAAEPLLQTTDASQGQVIEQRRVQDLPLNGRDYLQLALLSEGALDPPGQGRSATGDGSGGGSRAGGFSAGGQRTTDNNYLLDGFDNNTDDTSFDNNQGETIKPSVDAVREFKVQTNAYAAEFGRAAGGVVNLTLRSGTNRVHGTVYEFVRNDNLDARNFFDPAEVPPFRRNNYGFTLGGPVIKDKAFFFFSTEWLDRRESRTVNNSIPTTKMRRGDFSELARPIFDPMTFDPATGARQPFPGNIIPENRIDSVAGQLIDFYPAPQNAGLSRNFLFNPPDTQDLDRINTREDFQLSQNDHVSWMWNYQSSVSPASTNLPPPAFGGSTRRTDVEAFSTGISWTRVVSPTFVTTTKLGWDGNKFLIDFSPEAVALGDVNKQVGLVTPPSGLPVSYPSYSISGFTSLGAGNFLPVFSNGQTRQLKNDTSWNRGDHNFKFGIDVQWLQINSINARRKGGSFQFTGRYTRDPLTGAGGNALADFLLGAVNRSRFSTLTRADLRGTMLGGYLHDEWRVTPGFTLNLGVRYEYFDQYEDKFDQLANFDIDTDPQNPSLILSSQVAQPSFINTDVNNFQPRIGLAYQLIPEKVVVRAGYGIFYPLPRFSPFGDSDSILVNPPFNVARTTTSDGITPASLLKDGIPEDALAFEKATSVALASTERDPAYGYSQQWNLNLQYQLASNWMFQVGYFGNKGNHLANKIDANDVESLGPGNINQRRRYKSIFVPLSVPGKAGPGSGVVISPLGRVQRLQYTGNSSFHSLQAKVEHRFSEGFILMGAYLWSKGIGDTVGDNGPGISPGSGFQNPNNLRGERGLLDTHLTQRLVVSGIWEFPFGRGRQFGSDLHPVLNTFLGDWSFGGLMTLTAGRPFNVTVRGNPANSGQTNRADVVGDWKAVPGGPSVDEFFNTAAFRANEQFTYGNLGRNSLLGPSFQNFDLSLMKRTTLFTASDQPWDLQFRWEFFNSFNHTNFGFPGSTLGTSTFGQLTRASPGRKMQIGLKLIF
jgi:hypothetical protein